MKLYINSNGCAVLKHETERIAKYFKLNGADGLAFDTIVASGVNSYMPHAVPTDKKIEELVKKQYDTIIVSNDVASFSENIIKKYSKNEEINIIISARKE